MEVEFWFILKQKSNFLKEKVAFLYNLNGDPERARTVDLQRDRLAF